MNMPIRHLSNSTQLSTAIQLASFFSSSKFLLTGVTTFQSIAAWTGKVRIQVIATSEQQKRLFQDMVNQLHWN
jgi:hypothetical protein